MFDWLAYILVLCIEKSMCTSHSVAMIEVLLRRDKCCPFRSPEACARLFFFAVPDSGPSPKGMKHDEPHITLHLLHHARIQCSISHNMISYDIV